MPRTWFARATLLIALTPWLWAFQTRQAILGAKEVCQMDVSALVRSANASEPSARLTATRELLRRGEAILPELASLGVKPMATIAPPRADVIYSLIQGLSPGPYLKDSFGLHVDGDVNQEQITEMGKQYGFRLPQPNAVRPGAAPTCYVQLLPGRELAAVFEEILTHEARVSTVNLNYFER